MTKPSRSTSIRVLIVDDDEGIQHLLSLLFRREGWEVDVATNGNEALEMMRAHEPDVVLLDLMMPVSTGFDVLHHLQATAPAALRQIIVLTAASPAIVGDLARFGEIWRLLRKPFDILELRSEVAACAADQGRFKRHSASSAASSHARTAP